MSSWGRAAGLAIAGVMVLGGCEGDAPLGSAPPVASGGLLQRAPSHGDSGLGALAAGDLAKAEAQATAALRARPDDAYALLALATVYERSGRPELARQHYQLVAALQPQGSVMINGAPPRPLAELARAGLQRTTPAAAEAAPAVSPANAAERFRILRELVERGLVTEQEFALRRAANLGALLPYSESPPAPALDWAPPGTAQVAQRLRAIGQGLEGRSLTPGEHAAERNAILDALLPEQPRARTSPPPGGLDAARLGGHLAWLQSLRTAGLISPEELARERAAAERAAGVTASAGPAPQPLVPEAPASSKPATGKPATGKPAAGKPAAGKPAAPAAAQGGATVHLASLRSEKAARAGWDSLRKAHPDLLGSLQGSFTKVDVPGKGTFWRVNAGPLPDGKAAAALCAKLKAKRQYCDPAPARR